MGKLSNVGKVLSTNGYNGPHRKQQRTLRRSAAPPAQGLHGINQNYKASAWNKHTAELCNLYPRTSSMSHELQKQPAFGESKNKNRCGTQQRTAARQSSAQGAPPHLPRVLCLHTLTLFLIFPCTEQHPHSGTRNSLKREITAGHGEVV